MKKCLYEPCGKYIPFEQEQKNFSFCDTHCALMAVEMYYEIDKLVDPNFEHNTFIEKFLDDYHRRHGIE